MAEKRKDKSRTVLKTGEVREKTVLINLVGWTDS